MGLLNIFVGMSLLVGTGPTDRFPLARRNIAVFSNASFDFDSKNLYTDYANIKLVNCSDAKTVCFNGGPFSFSVPAHCHVRDGQQQLGKMRVVGTVPSDTHLNVDHAILLLAQSDSSSIIYEYDPEVGIVGLSYDIGVAARVAPSVDIEASYKQGRYRSDRGRAWSYSRRLTADNFAACASG